MKFRLAITLAAATLLAAGCGGDSKKVLLTTDGALGDWVAEVAADVTPEGDVADAQGELPEDVAPEDQVADLLTEDIPPEVELPPHCEDIPADWLDDMCVTFCDQLDKFNMTMVFTATGKCHEECVEAIEKWPHYLGNFLCVTMMDQHYFFSNCWWPKPLKEIPGCDAWCEEVTACGISSMFGVPEDPCLCEAACNGLFAMTGQMAEPLIACSVDALQDGCDVYDMGTCFSGKLDCIESCAALEDKCKDGGNLDKLFPNDDDCVDQCQEYTTDQFFALEMCLEIAGCGNADQCADVPVEALPGCKEYCIEYSELCPEWAFSDMVCPYVCTGIAMAIPGSDPVAAAECLAGQDECPEDPGYALIGCLYGKCTELCGQLPDQCEPGTQYFDLYPTEADCELDCEAMTDSQAVSTYICHQMTGCDNIEVCAETPAVPAEGCDLYCGAIEALCPDLDWFFTMPCVDFCTGLVTAMDGVDPAQAPECIEHFETCPENMDLPLFGCFGGKCGGICGKFEECESGSAYHQQYTSPDACQAYCDGLTWDEAMTATYCVNWTGCDDTANCATLPEQPAEGCDVYCDSIDDMCPEVAVFGAADCGNACTGMTMAFPAAYPGESAQCFEEYEECPEKLETVIYPCLVQTDEACQELCSDLAECDLTVDWLCDVFYMNLQQEEPVGFAGLKYCVKDAASCEAMKPCVGQ